MENLQIITRIKKEKLFDRRRSISPTKHFLNDTHLTFKTGVGSIQSFEHGIENDLNLDRQTIERLIEKFKKGENIYEDKLTFKKIEEIMDNRGELGEDAMLYIKTIREFETEYRNLHNVIIQMKRKEMDRINKEFYMNNYERRFAVSQKNVISALIGEDNTINEYSRQRREYKKYRKDLENIKLFNMLEKTNRDFFNENTNEN
jgi:hypothetical protein